MCKGCDILDWLIAWVNPWFWVTLSLIFFFMVIFGPKPMQSSDSSSMYEIAGVKIRWGLIGALTILTIVLPGLYISIAVAVFDNQCWAYLSLSFTEFLNSFKDNWTLPIIAFTLANLITLIYTRYAIPSISAFFRKMRVRQSGDELSDIRVEMNTLKTKKFLPSKYYKLEENLIFMGLDAQENPFYEKLEDWKLRNQKSIGPTQTGKGVHIGSQLDQAIRLGMTVFAIDPKPDDHMQDIMFQACEETGRKFISVDLNEGKRGKWGPFIGGSSRHRRQRILDAFGLKNTGEQADFYKGKERKIIDREFKDWDGRLESLLSLLSKPENFDDTERSRDSIEEWLSLDTFSPAKGRGFNIARSIEENAVVYIRASVDDDLVIKGGTLLLQELIQELKRLKDDGLRDEHLFIVVDELKFMVSDVLAKGMATILSKGSNMLVCYQTVNDLLSLSDKTLNEKAIKQGIEVNTKTTIVYQAADTETAKWASELTGTQQKSVTRMEAVEVGRYGAETWGSNRTLNKVEEQLIHENTFYSLPSMVGGFFRPNELAQIIYTSWVPVEKVYSPTTNTLEQQEKTTNKNPNHSKQKITNEQPSEPKQKINPIEQKTNPKPEKLKTTTETQKEETPPTLSLDSFPEIKEPPKPKQNNERVTIGFDDL